jgi:hypothetical protein
VSRRRKNEVFKEISLSWPFWYDARAPLGSAVRYLASLSPWFSSVGIYVLRGGCLELGPYMGAMPSSKRIQVGEALGQVAVVIPLRDCDKKELGQIHIVHRLHQALEPEEEQAVRKVAQELEELWPV